MYMVNESKWASNQTINFDRTNNVCTTFKRYEYLFKMHEIFFFIDIKEVFMVNESKWASI